MNILILTTHLELGGISSYTVSLAKKLKERHHNVWVASSGGRLVNELNKHNIEHIKVNLRTKSELNPKLIFTTLKLLKYIKKNKIDLIHAQTRISQVCAFYLSRLSKIPYVTTCHGFFKPKLSRRLFKFWGERTIAISDAVRVHLVNDLKVPKNKIDLIYNGIDLKDFSRPFTNSEKNNYKKQIGLKSGQVVGIIARLSEVKGHKYLLLAAEKILKAKPDIQFLIIGDGEEKVKLLKLSIELGINANVYFLPSTLDVGRALSIMNIYVMPSLQEGLGLSILEAMLSSLPVVASNVGGIYSIVEDGKNGFLVKSQDSDSLKDAILKLLNNRRMAESFGKYGQRKVKENFSMDILIKKVERTYQEAVRTYHERQ